MNSANINLLIRFHKKREIFLSNTQVLSILLNIAATSSIVERANFKELVAYWLATCVSQFRVRLPAMHRGELSAAITWVMSKGLGSKWKWYKGYKEMASPYPCFPANCEYAWKKTQI